MLTKIGLDLQNTNKITNLPLPTQPGDAVNKTYADNPLNFSVREYILPDTNSISTSSNVISPMAGFSLTTTTDTAVRTYKILLNMKVNSTIAAKVFYVYLYIGGVVSDVRGETINTANSDYSFDFEFWKTIPANTIVDFRWALATVGGTVTNISSAGQLSNFTMIGIPNTLFTL